MELPALREVGLNPMEWLAALIRLLHVHWHSTKRETARYLYRECRCGARRIDRLPGIGYEPIDVWWLDEKNRPQLRPPQGGSAVLKLKE